VNTVDDPTGWPLLAPPPAALDATAWAYGVSPFCLALIATMGREPLWQELCPTCGRELTCPTVDIPEPTHCCECCDCAVGAATCMKCGAFDEDARDASTGDA